MNNITGYQLVDSAYIPYSICHRESNSKIICSPCNNWSDIDGDYSRCDSNIAPIVYTLKSDNDFDVVKSNIAAMDLLIDPYECSYEKDSYCMNSDQLSRITSNIQLVVPVNDLRSMFSNGSNIMHIVQNKNANSYLNAGSKIFQGKCNSNQGVTAINTKIITENKFDGLPSSVNFVYKNPTHITYSTTYTCADIPKDLKYTTKSTSYVLYDDSKNDLWNAGTGRMINSISNNYIIYNEWIGDVYAKYKPEESAVETIHIPTITNEIITSDPNFDLQNIITDKSEYDKQASNRFKVNWVDQSLINYKDITLSCPKNFYLNGYYSKIVSNGIDIMPYCVKFIPKTEEELNGMKFDEYGNPISEGNLKLEDNPKLEGNSNSKSNTMFNIKNWIILILCIVICIVVIIIVLKTMKKKQPTVHTSDQITPK